MNHEHADFDKAWAEYKAMCMPDDAGKTQQEETRKAFYAGGAVVFMFINDWSEKDLPGPEGAAALRSLNDQFEAFMCSLEEGCGDADCPVCGKETLQ